MNDEISLSVGGDNASPALTRAEAATLYQGEKRLKGWDDEIEPAEFLAIRCVANETEGRIRTGMSGWVGIVAGIVMFAALVWWLGSHGEKVSDYFAGLFGPRPAAVSTDLSEAPLPLPVHKAPTGFKDEVEEINVHIEKKQWTPVVDRASAIEKNRNSLGHFKGEPDAHAWLYECLIAGEMKKKEKDIDAVLRNADSFEAQGGRPSFRILYNQMLARFEESGGEQIKDGTKGDYQVLRECAQLDDLFGVEITEKTDRVSKLRKVRIFSLIRILNDRKDLVAFDQNAKNGKINSEHWILLHKLIQESRDGFPKSKDAKKVTEEWKLKPKDHLRCEKWFWEKIVNFDSGWRGGTTIKIGSETYVDERAKYNKDRITEALNSK